LLVRLAALSNGKVATANPVDIFTHDLKSTRGSRPIWPWLLLLAALLLPFDIAVRRLIITKQDFAKVQEWITSRIKIQPKIEAPVQADPRMQALRKAKERTVREQVNIEPEVIVEEKTVSPPQPVTKVDEQTKSTTSALLERKRNSRK
jgi:hypothetical protein